MKITHALSVLSLSAFLMLGPVLSLAAPAGNAAIDSTLAALYDAFCFDPGQEPDWTGMSALFAPGAVFVAPFSSGDAPRGVDDATFLRDFRTWVQSDEMSRTGLHERIVHTSIDSYGVIGHAWVTFEAFYPKSGEVRGVGVDGIGLVLDGKRWKVASFTTQWESPEWPVPRRFWPQREEGSE